MPGEVEFDMASALADMSSGLGLEPVDETPAEGSGDEGNPEGVSENTPLENLASTGTPDAPEPEGTTETKPEATPPAAPGPDDPPNTWRPEAKAEWAALSPTVKAEIRKREEDAFRGIEGYKESANFGNSIKEVLRPYESVLRQHNIDPRTQIQGLMNSHYTLAFGNPEAKAALIQTIFRDYKIDPKTVFPEAGGEPAYVDPEVARLREEVQALKSGQMREQERQLAEARQANQRTVDAFFANTAKFPYANDLVSDMATLINKGVCSTLEEAYDKALWGNPAVRAKETARIAAEAEAKRAADAAAKADKQRRAVAANVRSSPRSGSAAAPLGSLDDTLNETLRDIQSRR